MAPHIGLQCKAFACREALALGAGTCRRIAAHEGVVAPIGLEHSEAPGMVDGQVADGCVVAEANHEPHCACVAACLAQNTRTQRCESGRSERPSSLQRMVAPCGAGLGCPKQPTGTGYPTRHHTSLQLKFVGRASCRAMHGSPHCCTGTLYIWGAATDRCLMHGGAADNHASDASDTPMAH